MLVIAKITKCIFGLYYVLLNFELGIYFVNLQFMKMSVVPVLIKVSEIALVRV